ncbi:MAG TPA: C1 family peptidase [Methanoregula sp.]|nr:C1 family peptidase [Methanoregula sp.]
MLLVIILALLTACIVLPVSAGKTIELSPRETITPASTNTERDQAEPSMNLSEDQMDELQHEIDTSPTYAAPASSPRIPRGSFSLLPDLPYVPKERNQGSCGDCWVWASTGAIEIEHTLKSGIRDRLSVQYFNDHFGSGPEGEDSACCSGSATKFVDWYSNKSANPDAMKLVPWSNANAAFLPGQSCDSPLATRDFPPDTPAYRMSSLSVATVSTFGVDKAAAINNIKSALKSGLPVLYAFGYDANDMKVFKQWWHSQPDTAIWDPSLFAGDGGGEGHVTLLVGYDDRTDPENPYWLVVNSWGAPPNRPDGTFRLSMNMNYDAAMKNAVSKSTSPPRQQQAFHIIDASFVDTPVSGVTGSPSPGSGIPVTDPSPAPGTPVTTPEAGSSTLPVCGALVLAGIFFRGKRD